MEKLKHEFCYLFPKKKNVSALYNKYYIKFFNNQHKNTWIAK